MGAGQCEVGDVRRLRGIIPLMTDRIDHDRLYQVAESQAGYFTTEQALATGMERSTLRHHARPGGRYQRIRRGLYRLRHFPPTPHEHVVAAWLALSNVPATVSHESALELYDLSDVIPNAIHVTVPREKRGQRPRTGVRFHTLEHPPDATEIRRVAGVLATSPERTIIDSLEAGTQLEQIELAVRQALERGLTTPRRLRAAAAGHPARVRPFIERRIQEVHSLA